MGTSYDEAQQVMGKTAADKLTRDAVAYGAAFATATIGNKMASNNIVWLIGHLVFFTLGMVLGKAIWS